MLMFLFHFISGFKNENMTSVLECSANLSSVQSELKIRFSVNSFSRGVILNSVNKSHDDEIFILKQVICVNSSCFHLE